MIFRKHWWTVSTIMTASFCSIDLCVVQITLARMDLNRLMSGRVRSVVAKLGVYIVIVFDGL